MKLNYYNFLYLLLAIVSGIFYGFASVILKKGISNFRFTTNIFELIWRLVTAKYIMVSFFFSGLGLILYMIIINKAEVIPSVLIIQSILFVSMLFFAYLLFGESISLQKIISLILITAGIVVLLAGK